MNDRANEQPKRDAEAVTEKPAPLDGEVLDAECGPVVDGQEDGSPLDLPADDLDEDSAGEENTDAPDDLPQSGSGTKALAQAPRLVRELAEKLAACLDEGLVPSSVEKSARRLEKGLLKRFDLGDSLVGQERPRPRKGKQEREHDERFVANTLVRIRLAAQEGQDTSALEALLRDLAAGDRSIRERMKTARKEGKRFFARTREFTALLRRGVLTDEVYAFWRGIRKTEREFGQHAGRLLLAQARGELKTCLAGRGRAEAVRMHEQMKARFGRIMDLLTVPKDGESSFVNIPRHTDHSLIHMQPTQRLRVYIDETGQSFSENEKGREGRIVAVCMRDGEELPPLSIHCTNAGQDRVLSAFAELLLLPCGILGLSRKSLDIRSANGWLQCVRELVKWIWRLVPLMPGGQKTWIDVNVERRGGFDTDTPTSFGRDMLNAELARENPQRAAKVVLSSLVFVGKDDPHSSWADVASYCWGTTHDPVQRALRESGLFDRCLIRHPSRVVDACEDIMAETAPKGDDWVELVKAHVLRTTPMTITALTNLRALCEKSANLWQEYAQAMNRYLQEPNYDPAAIEFMGRWIAPMRDKEPITSYFWLAGRLTHLNNVGDGTSRKVREVKRELIELEPRMRTLSPLTPLHVALLLARSEANALDFDEGLARLAPWDEEAGGTGIGTALWDGLVNLHLGCLHACKGDFARAFGLFRHAVELFGTLPKKQARKQLPHARVFLGRTALLVDGLDREKARACVSEGLDEEIYSLASQVATSIVQEDERKMRLLLHYLVRMGTEKEIEAHLSTSARWVRQEKTPAPYHTGTLLNYLRWLLVRERDPNLAHSLERIVFEEKPPKGKAEKEIPQFALGRLAIKLSMGLLLPYDPEVERQISAIAERLPKAEPLLSRMRSISSTDPHLALTKLPFTLL